MVGETRLELVKESVLSAYAVPFAIIPQTQSELRASALSRLRHTTTDVFHLPQSGRANGSRTRLFALKERRSNR